jgi:thiamine biosynthesis protein ThiS
MMQIAVNGETREVSPKLALLDLLAQMQVKPGAVVVERNGTLLRSNDLAGVTLEAGDRLEIVHFLGGG